MQVCIYVQPEYTLMAVTFQGHGICVSLQIFCLRQLLDIVHSNEL